MTEEGGSVNVPASWEADLLAQELNKSRAQVTDIKAALVGGRLDGAEGAP